MKFKLVIAISCLAAFMLNAQQMNSAKDSMVFFGDAMFSLKLSQNRAFAEERFLDLAKRLVLTNEDSILLKFHHSFISSESDDHLIKIISWQVESEQGKYHYCAFTFIPDAKPIFMQSVERNLSRISNESFNQDNWYGAMYYHFLPVKLNGFYTLLGYRFADNGYKYRIIELMKVDKGELVFGSPLFRSEDNKGNEDFTYRKIIGYSPSANMTIRYDEESQMIYFDHIEQITDSKSGEILQVPDGTFESYELKNNYWNYDSYHKLKTLDSPPIEKPVLGNHNKDLFGKEKKK